MALRLSQLVRVQAITLAISLGVNAGQAPVCAQAPPAPDSANAGDVLLVKAAGPGKLFLGGNLIEGPWTLAYDHGRFTANGFTLRPPPPPPPPPPPGSAERAEVDFLDAAGALSDSLSRSTLSIATRRERFVEFLKQHHVDYQLGFDSTFVHIRSARGFRVSFGLVVQTFGRGAGSHETVQDSRMRELNQIKAMLEQGHVVFLNRGVTVVGQHFDRDELMAAIARLRQGPVLDSLDLHLVVPTVRAELLNPLPVENIW